MRHEQVGRVGELKAGGALEVGGVASHQGSSGLKADAGRQRLVDLDLLTTSPQLSEQRSGT